MGLAQLQYPGPRALCTANTYDFVAAQNPGGLRVVFCFYLLKLYIDLRESRARLLFGVARGFTRPRRRRLDSDDDGGRRLACAL